MHHNSIKDRCLLLLFCFGEMEKREFEREDRKREWLRHPHSGCSQVEQL